MAASMIGRASGVFLLLTITSLHIPAEITANQGAEPFPSVSGEDLDNLANKHEHVLAFFHDGVCATQACQKVREHVRITHEDSSLPALKVVGINSDAKAKELGVESVPNLVFFHNGSPNIYPGQKMEVEEILEWIEGPPDQTLIPLDDTNFEHSTQAASGSTTGDWMVIFYRSTCSSALPTLQAVANRLKGRVVVARVDLFHSPQLAKRFKITNCPTLKFFRNGNMYDFNLPKYDIPTMVKFAEGWYKNSRMTKVPVELTPFDRLVEYVALSLKEAVEENHAMPLMVAGGAVTLVLVLLIAFCCSGENRQKTD